jgi:hypothetical protein
VRRGLCDKLEIYFREIARVSTSISHDYGQQDTQPSIQGLRRHPPFDPSLAQYTILCH